GACAARQPRPNPHGGAKIVELRQQLDGGVAEFGTKFWNLVLQNSPDLVARLQPPHQLTRICYFDRYLRSPTVVRLLYETLKRLRDVASRAASPVRVEITTSLLGRNPRTAPTTFDHDWESEDSRRDSVDGLLRHLGFDA